MKEKVGEGPKIGAGLSEHSIAGALFFATQKVRARAAARPCGDGSQARYNESIPIYSQQGRVRRLLMNEPKLQTASVRLRSAKLVELHEDRDVLLLTRRFKS